MQYKNGALSASVFARRGTFGGSAKYAQNITKDLNIFAGADIYRDSMDWHWMAGAGLEYKW